MSTILITGGAGFIGSYVVDELLRRNYSVVVADIHEEKYHHDVKFMRCDINNREDIEKAERRQHRGAGFSARRLCELYYQYPGDPLRGSL